MFRFRNFLNRCGNRVSDCSPMASAAVEFRRLCRNKQHKTHTSGYAPGYAQVNLLVLPEQAAKDFRDLCARNPVPCPLIGITPVGNPHEIDNKRAISDPEFDICTDFPSYNIYENGKLVDSKYDIRDEWNSNSVGFLIGCSFSFEKALSDQGLPPRNFSLDKNVSMYQTTRMLDPAGIFYDVSYVVSMRPYKVENLEKVRNITREFRRTHGEPIDWGYGAVKRLGIKDLGNPEFGDKTDIREDEIPIFWACGVTPQIAANRCASRIKSKVIGHSPGCMLVLDLKDEEVSSLR